MSIAGTGGLDVIIRRQLNRSNLTPDREQHLLRVCRSGSDEQERHAARTELWESHSKLVIAIASRFRQQQSIEFADLIGAGHLGLHTAIARFDPERFDGRLATYAIGWIRWHIQDYIRRNAAPLRLPGTTAHRQLARMGRRLFTDARKSCQQDGVEATESELCERIGRRIGLPADEVSRSLHLINGGAVSLHAQGEDAGPGQSLEDTLVAPDASPEDDVILRLDRAKARKHIKTLMNKVLDEREREVFLARCMGDDDEVTHLETLAERFGVTRERIYQLEASAKRKISAALAQQGYADFSGVLPASRARRRRLAPLAEGA